MLSLLFGICIIWFSIKLLIFGVKASWGILKFLCTVVLFPVILILMVVGEVRSTSGTLKGIYHYLNSPSPRLFPFVFISNVTNSLQMFRVCKNGKPIAFPLLLLGGIIAVLVSHS